MKSTRNRLNVLIVGLMVFMFGVSPAVGDRLYAPDYLWRNNIAEKTDPIGIADTHLRIPYRDDGALDDKGYFTTFDRQDRLFDTPGLNCSGLVVSVSRFLFNKNWNLQDIVKDPQGNSGSDSPLGKDWDFGLDLILNITENRPRRIVTPDRIHIPVENLDGVSMRGFDLHDTAAWQSVLSQMQPGKIYLGSISRPTSKRGYKVLHYHVVLMLPDDKGRVWLYHATRRSNVHRMNLNSGQGLHRLMRQFRRNANSPKRILIVETDLPNLDKVASIPGNDPEARQSADEAAAAHGSPETAVPLPNAAVDRDGNPETEKSAPDGLLVQNSGVQTDARSVPAGRPQPPKPELVIEHRSGKVYKTYPELVSHIPRFADKDSGGLLFWFRNRDKTSRNIEIDLRTPDGDTRYQGTIPGAGKDLSVVFPRDFANASSMSVRRGRYLVNFRVDGEPWSGNLFEVTIPREAEPRIIQVKAPKTVQSGKTFTVTVVARNSGAESDYGGITVSSPDPSGLRLVSAKPGKLYGRGSTVLSVMSDKIRTKVPMAERWINLWGENKTYDMTVRVKAGSPGTYPLYVRCALRGVNVKSSVVLMDPKESGTVDQQGFPVTVYNITVR